MPAANPRAYAWLRYFYLVMGFLWVGIGIANLIARPRLYGWLDIVLGIAFWVASALWFRKVRRS